MKFSTALCVVVQTAPLYNFLNDYTTFTAGNNHNIFSLSTALKC